MRRTLGLTTEYSPGGTNKILPLASLLAEDNDLTILSTGYSKRSDFVRIKHITNRSTSAAVASP